VDKDDWLTFESWCVADGYFKLTLEPFTWIVLLKHEKWSLLRTLAIHNDADPEYQWTWIRLKRKQTICTLNLQGEHAPFILSVGNWLRFVWCVVLCTTFLARFYIPTKSNQPWDTLLNCFFVSSAHSLVCLYRWHWCGFSKVDEWQRRIVMSRQVMIHTSLTWSVLVSHLHPTWDSLFYWFALHFQPSIFWINGMDNGLGEKGNK